MKNAQKKANSDEGLEENSGKIARKTQPSFSRSVIGLVEDVEIDGERYSARIDTGAARSSICSSIVPNLRESQIIKRVKVRSAGGKTKRPVIRKEIKIGGKTFRTTFSIADRQHMEFDVLIGRNTLRKGKFMVDTKDE